MSESLQNLVHRHLVDTITVDRNEEVTLCGSNRSPEQVEAQAFSAAAPHASMPGSFAASAELGRGSQSIQRIDRSRSESVPTMSVANSLEEAGVAKAPAHAIAMAAGMELAAA